MQINHKELPVTFLALCIESVTLVNITQTVIWDDQSSHPIFQYGGKENSISVSNERNPFSKMLAFTADLLRLDMDMIRVYNKWHLFALTFG